MSASKKPVNTPLHLLQQLSSSLLEHLESACSQALSDAEKLLAKLEKQRGKAQEKLHKSRSKLQDAASAGKAKAQTKAKDAADELEKLLDALQARQTETRNYIVQLKRDAQQSLELAQGVGKVQQAVVDALASRAAKPASKKVNTDSKGAESLPAAKPAKGRVSKAAAESAAEKQEAAVSTAKSTARASASKLSKSKPEGAVGKSTRGKSASAPAADSGEAKTPAGRRPRSAKAPAADQAASAAKPVTGRRPAAKPASGAASGATADNAASPTKTRAATAGRKAMPRLQSLVMSKCLLPLSLRASLRLKKRRRARLLTRRPRHNLTTPVILQTLPRTRCCKRRAVCQARCCSQQSWRVAPPLSSALVPDLLAMPGRCCPSVPTGLVQLAAQAA
jgi:hypothetical protein